MRVDLADDPAVIGISAECELDEDTVVGKLHKLWSWADRQTENGDAPSVTEAWLDRHVGVTGFAQAMSNAGWLSIKPDGISFPHFNRHNGKTAKTRALSAKRNVEYRKKRDAPSVTEASPREEKRREENKKPPTPFKPENEKLPFEMPTFVIAWSQFCKHRKEIKKPLTPTATRQTLTKLEAMGVVRATAALEHTTAMGWQGIREPDVERQNSVAKNQLLGGHKFPPCPKCGARRDPNFEPLDDPDHRGRNVCGNCGHVLAMLPRAK